MKITTFAGSNSKNSINKKLATYASSLFPNASVTVLDLNDFAMPIYSVDLDKEHGGPAQAQQFLDAIAAADILVISLAENNGNYSTAFKNIFDWASRIDVKVFQQKPTLLMATSPGKRGGASVLQIAEENLPRYGADVKAVFSLPSFNDNFDTENLTISDPELDKQLREIVANFNKA